MKLVNKEFDHRLIDECLRDKKGRIRSAKSGYNLDPDAVDFEETENNLEALLGHTYYNERHYHPAKQGRRKQYHGKSMTVSWWDERPGGSGNYEWHNFHNRLYGLIDKYIGKKFDDCFTALKERYITNKDWRRQACGIGNRRAKRTNLWMAIRTKFLEIFENKRYRSDYYVDDAGIIRKRPTKPKHPNRDIHKYEGEAYYVPNYGAIRCLQEKLNDARIDIVNVHLPDKVSIEFIQRWESSFRTLGYWQIRHLREACFQYVDERKIITIKYHSLGWYAIKGRSGKRRRKKIDRSAYYDRSLWVSNYLASHEEAGVNFHSLMENDIEAIRRDRLITAANRWICNVPPYKASVYGRKNYAAAIVAVMKSDWLDKTCKSTIWDAEFQLEYAVHNYLNPDGRRPGYS